MLVAETCFTAIADATAGLKAFEEEATDYSVLVLPKTEEIH